MRVVFGIILALGGIWLGWLVLTGLPFPWDTPAGSPVDTTISTDATATSTGINPLTLNNSGSSGNSSGIDPLTSLAGATVPPLGTGTLGAKGGAGWTVSV